MAMPRFSVIVVNYNGGDYVEGALASLARQTDRSFEVFLVDNASTDGSISNLNTAGLAHFKLLKQSENIGFAAANNLAAREATGDWIVLLNPDAEAAPDWLEQLALATQRHTGVNMFASTQYSLYEPDELDGVGDCYLGFGIPWRGGFGRPATELPEEGECFSPCGAGAMFRREIFLDHGGFDERFFCYCEDVDIGYRLRLAGERCVFLPKAVIHHAGGGLAGRASEFAIKHGARNRLWTFLKNTPLPLLALTAPLHLVMTLVIVARGVVTGRAVATLKGLCEGLAGLGPVLKQRREVQETRKASIKNLAGAMCWNPAKLLGRRAVVRADDSDLKVTTVVQPVPSRATV